MAVAGKDEIEKAMHLSGIIDDVERGYYPRTADNEHEEGAPNWFDEDDPEHLRAFYERVMDCGLPYRVTMGMAVLCDPRNAVIDPDLDHLELHPRLLEGRKAVDTPFHFWFDRLVWRHITAVKEAWL